MASELRGRRAVLLWLAATVAGCGVLASPSEGAQDLPDAHLASFRKLDEEEVDFAPFVRLDFTARWSGPSVIEGAAPLGQFSLFSSVAPDSGGAPSLRRATSSDPVAFATDEVVLVPGPEDEGGLVDPFVLGTRDGDALLFYGVGTGDRIGVARRQGDVFVPEARPALTRAPGEPSVGAPCVIDVDGAFWMYFQRGDGIDRAVSQDGLDWTPVGLVLGPGAPGAWDERGVGDPAALVYTSPLGRRSIRLYYTGRSPDDPPATAIGVAVSFDGTGDFVRLLGNPLFPGAPDEAGPALLSTQGETFLYFAQTSGTGRLGIGAAVDPP